MKYLMIAILALGSAGSVAYAQRSGLMLSRPALASTIGTCYFLSFCKGRVLIENVPPDFCQNAGGHSHYSGALGCQTF
ncbi:MAG: hypothetical protein ACXWQO_14570 [Bdellovibrionota bacterium]